MVVEQLSPCKYGEAGTLRINDADIMRMNLRPPA